MTVRIRFSAGVPKRAPAAAEARPAAAHDPRARATPASGLAGLLTPVSVVFAAFAVWKIAADLGIAHAFPLEEGAFSNWQIWFALALAVQVSAYALRRGKPGEPGRARGEGRV